MCGSGSNSSTKFSPPWLASFEVSYLAGLLGTGLAESATTGTGNIFSIK